MPHPHAAVSIHPDAGFGQRVAKKIIGIIGPHGPEHREMSDVRSNIRTMGRVRGGIRKNRAGTPSRPGRDRPRPSAAQAAHLARLAGPGRRYAGQDDAEVMLALGGWGALESWAAAQKIAAAQEMIRRRPASPQAQAAATAVAATAAAAAAAADLLPPVWDQSLGEELALELSCSVYSGAALADLSYTLRNRLPLAAAALEDGTLDMGKVRLIAAETAVLTDEQARAAEADIAGRWAGLTWGELRDLVTTAVINADPEGAAKRREEASKDARYRFCLDRGALTATLAGYSLPPADAIRADQRVRARARGYRRHGITGAFDQLCALAYLDLLTGRDARDRIAQDPAAAQDSDNDEAEEAAWDSRLAAGPGTVEEPGIDDVPVPDDPDAATLTGIPCPGQPDADDDPEPAEDATDQDDTDGDTRQHGTDEDDGDSGEGDSGEGGQDGGGNGGGPQPGPGTGPVPADEDELAANVDLIVPLADLTGYAQRAAQVRNLGGIDPALARDLTAMAARAHGSTFRIIITGPDGRAVAFGQATPIPRTPGSRHTEGTQLPLPSPAPPGDPPDDPAMPLASFTPATGTPDLATGPDGYGVWRLRIGTTLWTVRLHPVPGPGPCTHDYHSTGYKPGPVLRRLAEVRDGTCMLPGCNRSPRRSESEHCLPWPEGQTCSCNLGLACKKHNLMKKDPRWQVTQKPDGTRTWTAPGQLYYTKKPRIYPT